ncbi:MAG: hypothetical protein MI746_08925 [Pseudomonadales bacterium]|nr:hypothetical protein [Pseudomonadales bacterium]
MEKQPPPENLPVSTNDSESTPGALAHYFALTLSLPERTARALSALVGGGTLLLTQTLVPGAIKNSSSYHFTLGMFQTFLVQNVAGMARVRTQSELRDKFVHRKLVGSSLEAAGLLTMHFSPVWVFAIASDAAKGGQVFLQRLVHHLKENGVIDSESNPESLEQILQSIQDMSRQGATAIDTPPLSVQEIQDLANELRGSAASLTTNSSNLLPRFENLWNQITLVANKENMNLPQIMGMLSIQAASVSGASVGAAGAIGKTGIGILDEVILMEYRETLQGISEEGASNYLANHMQPFLENARSHFDFKQETITQRWFHNAMAKFRAKLFPEK